MSLKTRGSEKVPYLKSSYLRPFFCNQLIKCFWYHSHSITVHTCCRTHLTLLIWRLCRSAHPTFIRWCLVKNEPITLCLTNFYFHSQSVSKKIDLEEFDGKSLLRPAAKMGPKPRKALVLVK